MTIPQDNTAYAQAALDRECEIFASTTHGRNDQANRSAFSVGQLVGAGWVERSEAERRLMIAAEACGYIAKDGPAAARATIKSGLAKGEREPRAAPAPGYRNGHANGAVRPATVPEARPMRPAPQLSGVPLPEWTEPDEAGRPALEAVDLDEPPRMRDELPGRRHAYRRDGQAVRFKIKKASGSPFVDWYRVRRSSDGAIGWQAKRPAAYAPMPYTGVGNPFDPAMSGDVLFWPEGEKDVDTLAALGLAAFTFGGASDVPEGAEDLLKDRDVVVLVDNDEPGRRCGERKAERLKAVARRVRVLGFDELPPGGDVSDWLDAGGTVEGLWAQVDALAPVERPKPKFVLEPLSSIAPMLAGSWLIKGLMPQHGLMVIYGAPGCGKSFVALDVALRIAAGFDWAGRKVKQAGVVYVASEGGSGFRKRVYAARREHKIPHDAPFTLVVQPPNLGTEQGDAAELIACIKAQSEALEFKPGVVILDTLARSMTGGDENSARDMGFFIASAGLIERELGVLVIAVHHSGKTADRGMRGSSALHGATAAEWEVSSEETGRSIRIAKQKDGEDGLSILFRLQTTEVGTDEDNEPVTTLVADVYGGPEHSGTTKANRRLLKGQKAEFMKAVMMAIDEAGEIIPAGSHVPSNTRGVKRQSLHLYADALGFTDGKSAEVKRTTINRLIRDLCGDRFLGQWSDFIWLT